MKNKIFSVISVVAVSCFCAHAQQEAVDEVAVDSSEAVQSDVAVEQSDTAAEEVSEETVAETAATEEAAEPAPAEKTKPEEAVVIQPKIAKYSYDAIPKDPVASTLFSATFPGAGQIYNKEYLRGILTGVAFWGSFFLIQYELYRWEQLNTDTFYIEEAFGNPPPIHQVTSPKPEGEQVGLPTSEKVVLGAALAVAGTSYIFGIIDSFKGAKRYNKKLFGLSESSSKVSFSVALGKERVGVRARYCW